MEWTKVLILSYTILILFVLVVKIIIKKLNTNILSEQKDYQLKKYFFSYSELNFFYVLKNILEKQYWNQYIIFPKTRLADIFEPIYKSQALLNKIRAKHIDYIIVDLNNHCKPVLAIELNWTSHLSYKMEKSDTFKQNIFEYTWLPLIYFSNGEIENISKIQNRIFSFLWNINKPLQQWEVKEQN